MDILRIYVGETGGWYVQVEQDGQRAELSFDHLPTGADIEAALAAMAVPVVVPDIELEAEDGEII